MQESVDGLSLSEDFVTINLMRIEKLEKLTGGWSRLQAFMRRMEVNLPVAGDRFAKSAPDV